MELLLQAARTHVDSSAYALIATAVRAGLREGELAGLQWDDIQFGAGRDDPDRYLIVRRNYDRRWSKTMLTSKSRNHAGSI